MMESNMARLIIILRSKRLPGLIVSKWIQTLVKVKSQISKQVLFILPQHSICITPPGQSKIQVQTSSFYM